MDSLRHARRDRANHAERDSQPRGCPKGKDPVRRDTRQRGGPQRHGMTESGHKTPINKQDAHRYQAYKLSHEGLKTASRAKRGQLS